MVCLGLPRGASRPHPAPERPPLAAVRTLLEAAALLPGPPVLASGRILDLGQSGHSHRLSGARFARRRRARRALDGTVEASRKQIAEALEKAAFPIAALEPLLANSPDIDLRNLWALLNGCPISAVTAATAALPSPPGLGVDPVFSSPSRPTAAPIGSAPQSSYPGAASSLGGPQQGASIGAIDLWGFPPSTPDRLNPTSDAIFNAPDQGIGSPGPGGWPGATSGGDLPSTPSMTWASQLDEVVTRHGESGIGLHMLGGGGGGGGGGSGADRMMNGRPTSLSNKWDVPNVFGDLGSRGGPPGLGFQTPATRPDLANGHCQPQPRLQQPPAPSDVSEQWIGGASTLPPLLPAVSAPQHATLADVTAAFLSPDFLQSRGVEPARATPSQPSPQQPHRLASRPVPAPSRSASGSASTATPVEVFIPRSMVGRIIGKGGLVINQIRIDSGADVRIVDHESDQGGRTLTIQGHPAAVSKCQAILNSKLRGDDAQAVLFIPEDMVGRIIGKGGVNIKKLTLRSGADAHMGDPQQGRGEPPPVQDRDDQFAEDECAICLDAPMVEPERTYCDHTFCKRCIRAVLETRNDCPMCLEPVSVHDLKRVKARELRAARDARHALRSAAASSTGSSGSGRGRNLTIRGSPAEVALCREMVEAKLRGDDRNTSVPAVGPGENAELMLFVPEDMVGRIIGRGGAVIKQLRMVTTADVRMGDRDTAQGGRTLTIRGSTDAVGHAQDLVEGKLHDAY